MKIKVKMILLIGFVVITSFGAVITFVTIKAGNIAQTTLEQIGREMGARYGADMKSDFDLAMDAARNLAHTFEGIKKQGITDRKLFDNIQRTVLEKNPEFFGIWSFWKPNALDGRDRDFINTPGSDGNGRYIPCWYRHNGEIIVRPLKEYGNGAFSAYLATGKEEIMEPYADMVGGNQIMLTTVVVPIIVNGKQIGATGVNLRLHSIVDRLKLIKPYGSGYGYIVSNGGVLAAHHKTEIIGKNFIPRQPEAFRNPIQAALRDGKEFSLYKVSKATGISSFQAFSPFTVGRSVTPWSFIISIPEDTVKAEAKKLIYTITTISFAGLAIIGAMIWAISSSIVKPINQVVSGLKDIAGGSDQAVEYQNKG